METYEKVVIGIIGFVAFFLIVIIFTVLIGIHVKTSDGSHVGYVTSVEKKGLFFKTMTAYVKTDVQSSQEDDYCVVDEDVFNQLKILSEKHTHVEVTYFDWLSAGISNCDGEKGGIISKVTEIK